jgi:hypothetical protein
MKMVRGIVRIVTVPVGQGLGINAWDPDGEM